MLSRLLTVAMLSLFVPAGLSAQGARDLDSAKARDLVEKQVQSWKGEGAHASVIEPAFMRDIFPNHTFVAVHFPLWPVARLAPEPMKSQNLFVVTKDGKLTHLPDSKKLEEYFKGALKAEADVDKVTRGWLHLRMAYIQDGFYKFKYPAKAKEGPAASSVTILYGVVEVVPEMGNMGTFTATLRFNQAGQLASITEENKVIRGMRPRCQATLLLHPEKLVREIAEQDLLVMGRNAREYLMEQRAKANDELRREIDRVWRQIVAEGR